MLKLTDTEQLAVLREVLLQCFTDAASADRENVYTVLDGIRETLESIDSTLGLMRLALEKLG